MQEVIKKNGALFTKMYECPATGTVKSDVKAKVRYRIEKEVADGNYDLFDMVADMSKRIYMLERLLLRMAKGFKDNGTLPTEISTLYGGLIDAYVNGVDDETIKDRTDLENNVVVFNTLVSRVGKIAAIIEEEMY